MNVAKRLTNRSVLGADATFANVGFDPVAGLLPPAGLSLQATGALRRA